MDNLKKAWETIIKYAVPVKSAVQFAYNRFVLIAPKIAQNFPTIVASGGVMASVVSVGIAQNTSAQLQIAKSELAEVRLNQIQTPTQIQDLATKLADKSAQIDELAVKAEDTYRQALSLKDSSAVSIELLEDQKQKAETITANLNQVQQNLITQTQKVEANLTEVQTKIENANAQINEATSQIGVVEVNSAKAIELQKFIVDTQAEIAKLKSDLSKSIEDILDYVSTTNITISSMIADIDEIKNNIIILENANTTKNLEDSARDSQLSAIEADVIVLQNSASTELNANNTRIGVLRSTTDGTGQLFLAFDTPLPGIGDTRLFMSVSTFPNSVVSCYGSAAAFGSFIQCFDANGNPLANTNVVIQYFAVEN